MTGPGLTLSGRAVAATSRRETELEMWDHLGARNLLALQQMAAIAEIDRQIPKDWDAGYGVDVDALLDRRKRLVDEIKRGRAA